MQLLPDKSQTTLSSGAGSPAQLQLTREEQWGLKNVYWGLCWIYLSILLAILASLFTAGLSFDWFEGKLDAHQVRLWNGVALAARGGLWLAGSMLMLSVPKALRLRKLVSLFLLLDASVLGIQVAGWFGIRLSVDLLGLRMVSFGLFMAFLSNLARAVHDDDSALRCRKVLNKIVFAGAFLGIAYVGVEYHQYLRYAGYAACYFFFGGLIMYFTTLRRMRGPIRKAYGFA